MSSFQVARMSPAEQAARCDFYTLEQSIHADWVEQTFPMIDFVRLKHRGLLGAGQILHKLGEQPKVGG